MDRKEHFVKLTLSANDQPIWIRIESIVSFYSDSNRDGEEVTRITTTDGDYSIVKEEIDRILYAIDEYFNTDWYKEAQEDDFEEAVNPDFCDEEEGKIPEHIDKALDLLYEEEKKKEEKRNFPKRNMDIDKEKAIYTLVNSALKLKCDDCPLRKRCGKYIGGCMLVDCVKYLDNMGEE